MKNLLIITIADDNVGKDLFENISKELFDLYLTVDGKYLDGNNDDEACKKLNLDFENAIEIINPADDRLKNLDGIITIRIIT